MLHSSFCMKKPDKKQTSQSVSCPAVVSLNNAPSERTKRIIAQCTAQVKRSKRLRSHAVAGERGASRMILIVCRRIVFKWIMFNHRRKERWIL